MYIRNSLLAHDCHYMMIHRIFITFLFHRVSITFFVLFHVVYLYTAIDLQYCSLVWVCAVPYLRSGQVFKISLLNVVLLFVVWGSPPCAVRRAPMFGARVSRTGSGGWLARRRLALGSAASQSCAVLTQLVILDQVVLEIIVSSG